MPPLGSLGSHHVSCGGLQLPKLVGSGRDWQWGRNWFGRAMLRSRTALSGVRVSRWRLTDGLPRSYLVTDVICRPEFVGRSTLPAQREGQRSPCVLPAKEEDQQPDHKVNLFAPAYCGTCQLITHRYCPLSSQMDDLTRYQIGWTTVSEPHCHWVSRIIVQKFATICRKRSPTVLAPA